MQVAGGLRRGFWQQKRWWVALMLLAVTMISYIDRLALSVAAPLLKAEFGFSNEEYGRITLAPLLHQRPVAPGVLRVAVDVRDERE